MLQRISLCLFAAFALAAPFASADTFMGVEEEKAPDEEPAAKTPKASAKAMRKESTRRPVENVAPPSGGDVNFAGSLSPGANSVGGRITVDYSFNRYVALDTTGFYTRYERGDTVGEQYGPEVDLLLRAPNPTIVTPYLGAGPGYIKWRRSFKDEVFSSDQAFTLNTFGGLGIRLTKHFGVHAERRQTRYYAEPPKRLDDREVSEGRVTIANSIGFQVMF